MQNIKINKTCMKKNKQSYFYYSKTNIKFHKIKTKKPFLLFTLVMFIKMSWASVNVRKRLNIYFLLNCNVFFFASIG